MLSTRCALLTWAVLISAMVASAVAQTDEGRAINDPNEAERAKVVELLMQAIKSADPQNEESQAMTHALEFIQRNQALPSTQLQYWNGVDAYWAVDNQLQRYSLNADVHSYLAEQAQPSPYWIGVQSEAANQYTLKVEGDVNITGQGGLLVTTVTQDSPAEKAGLKVNDIILQFGDAKTDELGQLIAAIKSNADSPARLLVVRDERIVSMEITPRLRDSQPKEDPNSRRTDLADAWVEIYGKTLAEGVEATVRFNRNGVTEIQFHQGDEAAEAKADELDKLPVVYRGFARSLVKNLEKTLIENENARYYMEYTPKYYQWDSTHLPDDTQKAYWRYGLSPINPPQTDQPVNDRLERLEKQIQALTQAIHELKKD